jgi:mannose-6-phosphate isomerase-like protein (cupin superfamily)
MKQRIFIVSVAVLAFVLGVAAGRMPLAARAAGAPLSPAAIDLLAIGPDAMPPPSATFPNMHTKTLVATDGMTLAVQMGTAPKHIHAAANEIQIVLDGTGTEWLGQQQVALKPGTMVVIPSGTIHAGLTDTSGGHLRWVSIKTPPQDPSDVHFVSDSSKP